MWLPLFFNGVSDFFNRIPCPSLQDSAFLSAQESVRLVS